MIDEVRIKYSTRVDKTFQSIREIFNEKVGKLAKFEKEMKELEKDVRLNYSNIIKLMDLDPFYEIIYRYNKKLNNIKSVFNEFKGKPDEIPEDAVRVKSMKSQLGFVAGFGRKLENFFSGDASFDSNNSSGYSDIGLENLDQAGVIDVKIIQPVFIAPSFVFKKKNISSKAIQTEFQPTEIESNRKKITQFGGSSEIKDDLKAQAEMLIKSVDTLICSGENTGLALHNHQSRTNSQIPTPQNTGEPRQSNSITKAEIAKRIQAHFNNSTHIGKPKNRSTSNTLLKTGGTTKGSTQTSPILMDKKQSEAGLAREIETEEIAKELSSKNKEFRARGQREKSNPVPSNPQIYFANKIGNLPQPQQVPTPKPKMNKHLTPQQSSGTLPSSSKDKEREERGSRDQKPQTPVLTSASVSKTERLLQLYRKNKQGT